MSRSVLYMSMSLDGFIAGPDDGPENGLGTGGDRLHDWLFAGDEVSGGGGGVPELRVADASRPIVDELMATGAVLTGRRTFEAAGGWGGDHHDGVPVVVFTRREPGPDDVRAPNVHYETGGIEAAMARAKDGAGDRNVLVHGATTAQLALRAGVLDELEIHQVPVLLGAGRRLFEGLGTIGLDAVRVIDAPGVTHLHYRVAR
ncbi:dihydrofolate reductase family protein [Jiangella anatolica]|uniref:Riboflavin biosynthesis protein RibD n=1 Tax=Jiangella anatolica TaxID=2670374 RepID=A0A2W2CAE2_9ACTN|nr:dihydrofolate reductase family protein [Jiangella anatolica]PZF85129.1 riboflavin biosynthesis protein RibD [Jiangella anatolica]